MLLLGSIRSIMRICIVTRPSCPSLKGGALTHSQALSLSKRARDVTALRCSEPLRSKVGGPIKGLARFCGLGPPGDRWGFLNRVIILMSRTAMVHQWKSGLRELGNFRFPLIFMARSRRTMAINSSGALRKLLQAGSRIITRNIFFKTIINTALN